MNSCACGNATNGTETRCERCSALTVLGLEPDASEEQMRSAYHLLVKVWHPDRFQSDGKTHAHAEEKLKAINDAYRKLKDGLFSQQPARPARAAAESAPPLRQETMWQPSATESRRTAEPGWLFGMRRVFIGIGMVIAVGAAAIGLLWIVFKPLDAVLSSNPMIGKVYVDARDGVASGFEAIKENTWDEALTNVRRMTGHSVPPTTATEPQPETETQMRTAQEKQPVVTAQEQPQSQPQLMEPQDKNAADHYAPTASSAFITAGLRQEEVEKTLGAADTTTPDKLIYGRSELYFTSGKLAGWKIDAASPIRVKLWPDAPVNPELKSFTVGSSKNEVLVVQGTPTFFSANTFGYGNSEVYFQNDRVVRWKDDPGSVQLRAGSQQVVGR